MLNGQASLGKCQKEFSSAEERYAPYSLLDKAEQKSKDVARGDVDEHIYPPPPLTPAHKEAKDAFAKSSAKLNAIEADLERLINEYDVLHKRTELESILRTADLEQREAEATTEAKKIRAADNDFEKNLVGLDTDLAKAARAAYKKEKKRKADDAEKKCRANKKAQKKEARASQSAKKKKMQGDADAIVATAAQTSPAATAAPPKDMTTDDCDPKNKLSIITDLESSLASLNSEKKALLTMLDDREAAHRAEIMALQEAHQEELELLRTSLGTPSGPEPEIATAKSLRPTPSTRRSRPSNSVERSTPLRGRASTRTDMSPGRVSASQSLGKSGKIVRRSTSVSGSSTSGSTASSSSRKGAGHGPTSRSENSSRKPHGKKKALG